MEKLGKLKKEALIKVFLIQVFTSIDFILPIRILYMLNYGIENGDIGILRMVYSLGVTLLEVPTGAISDKISKRVSIILSALAFSLHAVFYIVMPNFIGFLLTQICLALCAALASGTTSAYVHDITVAGKMDYTKVAGNMSLFKSIFSLIMVSGSSILYLFNPRINFVVIFLTGTLGIFIAYSLPETRAEWGTRVMNIEMSDYFKHIRDNVKYLLDQKWLLYLILVQGINISFLIFNFDFYQIIFKKLHINTGYIGAIYASFFLWGGIGAKLTHYFVHTFNSDNILVGYMSAIAVSYFVIGNSSSIVMIGIVIILQQICFGSWNLLVESEVLAHAKDSDSKAILESLHSCIFNLIKGILVFFLSGVMYNYDLPFTYNFMGVAVITVCIYVILTRKNWRRSKYTR